MNKMNELCEMELTGRYEEKLSALKAEISVDVFEARGLKVFGLRTDMSA